MIGARWNRGVRPRPLEDGSAGFALGPSPGVTTEDPRFGQTRGPAGKRASGS